MSDTFIADLQALRNGLARLAANEAAPCPHIRSSGQGDAATHWCELAAADARDAARYRHLRDHYLVAHTYVVGPGESDPSIVTMDRGIAGDDADEAIDNDMRRMRDEC